MTVGIPPPPGWYDDPWQGGALRWWDGYRWTEHAMQSAWAASPAIPPTVPGRRRLSRVWFDLSIWLQVLLGLTIVLNLVQLGGAVRVLDLAQRWHHDPSTYDDAASSHATDLLDVTSTIWMFLFVGCGAVFITWLYLAHRSDRMAAEHLHHRSGWAIGGWFIPFVAFVFPLLMITDTARGATRNSRAGGSTALRICWSVCFALCLVAEFVTFGFDPVDYGRGDRSYYGDLRDWSISNIVTRGLWVLGAALAILVVRQVTCLVREAPVAVPESAPAAPRREYTPQGWSGGSTGSHYKTARPQLGRRWFTLSTWLRWTLVLLAAANAAQLGSSAWETALAGRWATDDSTYSDSYTASDYFAMSAAFLQVVVFVACGIMFVVWLYMAHHSDRMNPDFQRHDSGWAIGAWLVPVFSWWRPFQMVRDTERGASPDGSPTSSIAEQLGWWVATNLAVTAFLVLGFVDPSSGSGDADHAYFVDLRRWSIASASGAAVGIVAAVLTIVVVRRVTEVVRESPHGNFDAALTPQTSLQPW